MDAPNLPLPLSFEDIFAAAPDAVVVHDLNDVVLAWNPMAEKLYGWAADEIIGRAITKIFYLDAEPRSEAVEALRDQGSWEGELRQIDRNGDEYLVQVRQQLHRSATGQPAAVISFNTNITEERKKEDAAERAHHVQSSSILAGGFAHELNNALAPIMLSAAMLKRSLEDEKSKNMVSMIEKCANKGAGLIADLLSFERGKGGGLDVIRKTQVERAIKRVATPILSDSVQFELEVAEDLWEIRGDAVELSKVFECVIQNSNEAMPDGGQLKVEVRNRLFDENFENLAPEAKAGAYVSIIFTDTGHGIEENIIRHVAEPFFTTKTPKQGFGFGLASSQAIIKGHKGFMVLESTRGEGTTLSLFLPADAKVEDLAGTAPPFPIKKEGNGLLILVADDEFFIRETIKKTLEERGYNVITVQDGTEALAAYASRLNEISMVVTNIEMPFMDGPALCRALKKLNPNVKILVSSGHKQREKIQSIKACGVQHFLAKPYTADNLADRVYSILQGDPAEAS